VELPARLRIAITRLNRRLRQESVTGLSPAQESALATIRRLGNPTLGELAQVERVQPPTMTRIVGAMERAGLVRRVGDAGDKRVCRVELTAAGGAAIDRIRSLKNAYLARQIKVLAPSERARLAELIALCERLVDER
jgi:DNA-binding MarR family transcriptional regulator